uniref:Uncharacterized protein n=1 Tax=Meloidogyne incognita TaxID=6306 RepID=A0A914LWD2_MELIC
MAANFLNSWLHLPSLPIVFVDLDNLNNLILISQKPKIIYYYGEEEEGEELGEEGGVNKKQQVWPIPIWIECLEGTFPEQLFWLNDNKENNGILIIPLNILTKTNSTTSLAFNRNRPVYYQLNIRKIKGN